jgi:hypothetical protein
MNSDRARTVEPREEHQFLQVIGKSVGHYDARRLGAGQPITDFQVVLTGSHLPGMAPGWRRIIAERIVHPFANFAKPPPYPNLKPRKDPLSRSLRVSRSVWDRCCQCRDSQGNSFLLSASGLFVYAVRDSFVL